MEKQLWIPNTTGHATKTKLNLIRIELETVQYIVQEELSLEFLLVALDGLLEGNASKAEAHRWFPPLPHAHRRHPISVLRSCLQLSV